MDTIASLREAFTTAHWMLEGTIDGVTPELVAWHPGGTALTIAATYAHLVLSEDRLVTRAFEGKTPLASAEWDSKTGISELPPTGSGADWSDWARGVRVDVPAFRQYAQAVYAATDGYLAKLSPHELDREIERGSMGKRSLNWWLTLMVVHAANHTGEISAVKGLQGLKGYPL